MRIDQLHAASHDAEEFRKLIDPSILVEMRL